MIHYAGIGSRQTPKKILNVMSLIGKIFATNGFVLRSGGAEGADTAFEKGCDLVSGKKEIFLPWKGFNKSDSNLYTVNQDALSIAEQFHPNFYALSDGVKKLIGRNTYQVLGGDCMNNSQFVVCYTKDGKDSGGTGQAIRIALAHNIPIFNLFEEEQLELLKSFAKELILNSNNI